MNLEALRRVINQPKQFEWNGETVWLKKIGAADGLAFFAKIKELEAQTLTEAQDREATLDYYARAIAKSLCDEAGLLVADSEEGIDTLKTVNFNDLVQLGDTVLRHSGFRGDEEAKKNLATTSSPRIDSALELDSGPTPITSSPG